MKTDLEVVAEAISLIEADGGWCKGTYCQDARGDHVLASRTSATGWTNAIGTRPASPPVSFCLEGALRYAAGVYDAVRYDRRTEWPALKRQAQQIEQLVLALVAPEYLYLHDFNDATSQEEAILALKTVQHYLERDDGR